MELFKLIIDFLVSLCLLGGYIITGYVLYLAYTTGNPFSYIMFFVLLFFPRILFRDLRTPPDVKGYPPGVLSIFLILCENAPFVGWELKTLLLCIWCSLGV